MKEEIRVASGQDQRGRVALGQFRRVVVKTNHQITNRQMNRERVASGQRERERERIRTNTVKTNSKRESKI